MSFSSILNIFGINGYNPIGKLLCLFGFGCGGTVETVFDFESLIFTLLSQLSVLLWVLAIATFFFGLVKFIKNAEDSGEHEQGRKFMVGGIIAFTVLVSLWGIVRLVLVDTLGYLPSNPQYMDSTGNVIR